MNDYIKTSRSDYGIRVERKAIRSFFLFLRNYLYEANNYINCLSIVNSVENSVIGYCGTILNDS